MRELVVTEFVSLDGVMQSPGGEPGYAHAGWVGEWFSEELGSYKLQEQLAADTLVLGRKTYASFSGAWPERDDAMADKINAMDKVLVSTTVTDPGWHNVTVVASLDGLATLKDGDGGPILVVGSRSLVHSLLAAGLVDELHLQVFPVVLGSGARVYPDSSSTIPLTLTKAIPLTSGVVLQEFRLA